MPPIVGAQEGGAEGPAHLVKLHVFLLLECSMGHALWNLFKLVTLGVLPFWAALSAFADSGLPPLPPTLDPPAITAVERTFKFGKTAQAAFSPFSHGEPTAEEQYMLELINRARASPAAEGLRLQATTDPDILGAYAYFHVDLAKVVADFASYPSRPPLAFNVNLIAAARGHSQDMAVHDFQGHTGSGGSSFTDRIATAGYTGWNAAAENVYAYSDSVSYGHAGFNVDWGVPSLGHRMNIMNFSAADPVYTEIGIGIVSETSASTAVGPLVVTEDFGRRSGQLYVVGVVYQDQNHDALYSIGEGIGGVTVSTSQGNYAYTSASGGYAIPLTDSSGSVTVRAEGAALGAVQEYSVTLAGTNVKADFISSTSSDQTIAFFALASRTLGSAPFILTALASSGLPVAFTSRTTPVCTVSGSTVTLVAVGTCTIRASQAGDSHWNVATPVDQNFSVLPLSSMLLSVMNTGTGIGTVTSSPLGITCGSDCRENYADGTGVTLTATPNANAPGGTYTFAGWGGDCASFGTQSTCTLRMNAAKNVSVTFSYIGAGSDYSRDYVQKAYVAYYGRPADPGGQSYWASRMDAEGQSLAAIIGAFGYSDEFNRRYGGLSYTQLVTRIYQQTLGRDPDQDGLNWYVAELVAGRRTLQTITLDVRNGATTAPDATVVANKLTAAAYYTTKVAAGCAYGTEQDGVDALAIVTALAASVAGAEAAIDAGCGP